MPTIQRITLDIEGDIVQIWSLTYDESKMKLIRVQSDCLAFFQCDSGLRIGVNAFRWKGENWIHSSCSREDRLPDYNDLKFLKQFAHGDRFAAQIFPPERLFVNIHPNCLHLWGPMNDADWKLPIMGESGMI